MVLATDNLKDFTSEVLLQFDIHHLHPGDVLDLVALLDAEGLSKSLQKTTTDFKNPQFELVDMLVSIRSAQQFDNVELATKLQARWGLGISRC